MCPKAVHRNTVWHWPGHMLGTQGKGWQGAGKSGEQKLSSPNLCPPTSLSFSQGWGIIWAEEPLKWALQPTPGLEKYNKIRKYNLHQYLLARGGILPVLELVGGGVNIRACQHGKMQGM